MEILDKAFHLLCSTFPVTLSAGNLHSLAHSLRAARAHSPRCLKADVRASAQVGRVVVEEAHCWGQRASMENMLGDMSSDLPAAGLPLLGVPFISYSFIRIMTHFWRLTGKYLAQGHL